MSPLISVSTARLGEHLPLLDLLPPEDAISWVRGNDGLVGWGIHSQISITGHDRFERARTWWHQQLETFAIENSVHGSGTGPVLFASFSFDPSEESFLVIPKVIVGSKSGKSWITWIGNQQQPVISEESPSLNSQIFTLEDGTITIDQWKSKVKEAISEVAAGHLEKVVLARDLIARAENKIDLRPILQNLSREYPSTWTFAMKGLIGATPELLLRLTRGMVTSRVLAGTISKTGDDEKDLALAASLARSSKDLEEHEYAVRSVAEALEPFCSSTNVPDSPYVLHLSNVMHLATDVTGALLESNKAIDAFLLLEKLHPSAAVCGTPRAGAALLLNQLEEMNRGRYAGPIGWIDARGDGELGIALRCGQISEETIRIFAGCGIVAGSNPEKELLESSAKFAPMASAMRMSPL